MANVLIKNYGVQPRYLNTGTAVAHIPGATEGPAGVAPGYAMVDDSLVAEVRKVRIVDSLFREGVLVIDAPAQPKAEAPAPVVEAPVIEPEAPTENLVEATLAGVADKDGNVTDLKAMKKDELIQIASDMGIEGAADMTKAQLIAAIEAEPVLVEANKPGE